MHTELMFCVHFCARNKRSSPRYTYDDGKKQVRYIGEIDTMRIWYQIGIAEMA